MRVKMNIAAKHLLWAFITAVLSIIAAVLIHPTILLGVLIGIITTTLKDIHCGD
jgi:hypothetical protein